MKLFKKKESDYYDYDYEKDYVDDKMASLDDDVTVAEEKLNRSIKRKRQARDIAVEDRVKEETDGLRAENKRLKKVLVKIFKRVERPAFCATRLYFALFAPNGLMDYLIILLSASITFFAVPFTMIKVIQGTTVGKVFLYIGICVFFAGVYYLVLIYTKPKAMWETIIKGRPILGKIRKNKQEIRRISKNIRHDKDDSKYDLEEFDNEITRNQGLYDVALARKNDFIKSHESYNKPDSYYDDSFLREHGDYYEEPEVEFREFNKDRRDDYR